MDHRGDAHARYIGRAHDILCGTDLAGYGRFSVILDPAWLNVSLVN